MVVIFIIMKHFITFISTMALLLLLAMPAFSQEITVRFIGQINGTDYCRLDRVAVINVTRNWTEMVEYPDTIIVLGGTVGANLNIAAEQGLGQNIPNPFDCETRVELSLSQSDDVRMQLLDVVGKVYAEYNASLDAGVHTFDISAANPQTYLLNATVGNRQYSIRMVNVGSGCGCSIKYAGVSGGIEAKLTSANEFLIGDNMRYVGYTTIDGESVASAIVEQMQVISQTVTLNFTHYFPPRVETLSATNITTTGATLNGNVTSDGGATVTARGFKYGTSADNLSQSVESGNGTGSYTRVLTGLSASTTYYYKAYATNTAGTAYGDVMSFTTEMASTSYSDPTGYLNGYGYVDLGLPSGTKWATCNVGASTPTAYGNYYAWGETTTKSSYTEDNYTYSSNPTTLPSSADAATANWGSGWRMPTYDEMYELQSNCTVTLTTQSGVNGRLFTGPNGNSIFLPAAGYRYDSELNGAGSYGYYWSSSLRNTDYAWELYFDSDRCVVIISYRYYGFTVRPVCVSTTTTTVPSVTTSAATNITSTTVTLNGNVTSDGGATVTARGFVYGTSANNLTQSVQSGSGTGSFTKTLTGLSASTTYYYKAYATNSEGTAYGEVMWFTMENNASLPTVVTNDATNVTSTGATLNGIVTNDGGATVTERGFIYGDGSIYEGSVVSYASLESLVGCSTVQCGSGTGSFTANITDYYEGSTVFYKAYATNSEGTAYGEVMWFTMENNASLPTVVTNDATNVTSTGATLNGIVTNDGGATVTERGFMYATSELLLSSVFGSTVQCGSGTGSFTANLTGYDDGTVVYYKAYATNSEGTAYGEVMSFTTGAFPPTVQTNSASNITATSAKLSGNVTFNGGATVTARGFMYGTDANNLSQSIQSGSGTGSYTKTLSGLSASTTYYYKAYATNSEGTAYGEVMSFTTEDASLPTVVTNDATNVTPTGGILNGNVTSDGGATVTERGFIYIGSSFGGNLFESLVGSASLEFLNNCSTVQCGSGTGSFSANITDYADGTTIYYKAYATNSVGTAYGEVTSTAELNGHEFVDLGLPSGLFWATCNVGASTPEGYGDYYAWGETSPKSSYSSSNYTYSSQPTTLPSNKDAATANWGNGWRMPTRGEFNELINNCTITWTTRNGVNGWLFTSNINGNSIFLPAAGVCNPGLFYAGSRGYYWSSSLNGQNNRYAYSLAFDSDNCGVSSYERYKGLTVRPVCEP